MNVAYKAKTDAEKHQENISTAIILSFAFMAEVMIFPIAVFVLFLCILDMILQRLHKSEKALIGDTNFYRTKIRPLARILVWAPVALLITIALVAIAIGLRFIIPLTMVAIPVGLLGFLIVKSFTPEKQEEEDDDDDDVKTDQLCIDAQSTAQDSDPV